LNLKKPTQTCFQKIIKKKMQTKHTPSIPQNLLVDVNKKFERNWMSKVWKYCSLREKKNTFNLKHYRPKQSYA